MTETLLLISIGPVQDFIASARKLRDLWTGSHMLSEFSKTVARTLVENGAELIFPAVERVQGAEIPQELIESSELIVANKILAVVGSPEEAESLQQKAREAWQAHFNSLGKSTLSVLEEKYKQISINLKLFDAELRDYGEFFAVWTPVDSSEYYRVARARVESLLAARKNFRAFQTPSWEGVGIRKNSLDGMRESVFMKDPREITGLLKEKEKLDAIGCIKRFVFLAEGVEKKHFSDLAEIALIPWIIGADNISLRNENGEVSQFDLIEEFQDSFPGDARAYISRRKFTENFDLKVGAENFFRDQGELKKLYGGNAQAIWDCRKAMVRKFGEPSPYSVIMVGDGDRMGEMINEISDKEMHKQFSRKLSEFSKKVAPVVEGAGGSLIYAGGDDVMAYLPLHTAIECADKIRKMFHSEMETLCETIGLDTEKASTFSIGLAVVHYKYPLDRALELARKAESIAKESGRNSLALIQSKRSGTDITVIGKWDAEGDLPGIADRIETICRLYNSEGRALPSKLGYDLRRVKIETGNSKMKFTLVDGDIRPDNVAAALVRRVFDQKNDGDAEKNRQLRELLMGRTNVEKLSNELVVGRLFAQAQKMAEGKVQADA